MNRIDVCTQVFAVGSFAAIGTGGLQVIVPAISAFVTDEFYGGRRIGKEIVGGPRATGCAGWSGNKGIGRKDGFGETGGEGGLQRVMKSTVRRTPAGRPHWISSRTHNIVGENKIPHLLAGGYHVAHDEQTSRRERSDVIDGEILKERGARTDR